MPQLTLKNTEPSYRCDASFLIDIDVSARICSKWTWTNEGRRTLMTSTIWLLKSSDGRFPCDTPNPACCLNFSLLKPIPPEPKDPSIWRLPRKAQSPIKIVCHTSTPSTWCNWMTSIIKLWVWFASHLNKQHTHTNTGSLNLLIHKISCDVPLQSNVWKTNESDARIVMQNKNTL